MFDYFILQNTIKIPTIRMVGKNTIEIECGNIL